jgi:hypothetical protein
VSIRVTVCRNPRWASFGPDVRYIRPFAAHKLLGCRSTMFLPEGLRLPGLLCPDVFDTGGTWERCVLQVAG